jgi:hypothetical protein
VSKIHQPACGKRHLIYLNCHKLEQGNYDLRALIKFNIDCNKQSIINEHIEKMKILVDNPHFKSSRNFFKLPANNKGKLKAQYLICDKNNKVRLYESGTLKFLNSDTIHLPKKIHCTLLTKDTTSNYFAWTKLNIIQNYHPAIVLRKRRNVEINFDHFKYTVNIPENAIIGSKVIQLNANGGSGEYTYSLGTGVHANARTKFGVEPETGILKVLGDLDRDTGITRYVIDVEAKDKSNPDSIASTAVIISLTDVNDNAPMFAQNAYTKLIKEEMIVGKLVLTVDATDRDIGSNAKITYSMEKDKNIICPFDIHPNTGKITTNQILDREEKAFYTIKVMATDHGNPAKSSHVTVNITLEDINDNMPVFPRRNMKWMFPRTLL